MNAIITKLINVQRTAWLLVASLAYLAHEFAFHTQIIDAALAGNAGELEVYGRALAGIGAALMVVRLYRATTYRVAAAAIGMAILVYIAQGLLVDSLVSRSTAESRWTAQYALLMQHGLRHRAIVIDGISPEVLASTAQYSALIALAGPVLMQPEYVARARQDFDRLSEAAIRDQVADWLAGRGYEQYVAIVSEARGSYAGYLEQMRAQRAHIDELALRHFPTIERRLATLSACRTQACLADGERVWRGYFKTIGVPEIPWRTFCDTRPTFIQIAGQSVATTTTDCGSLSPAEVARRARTFYQIPEHEPALNEYVNSPQVRGQLETALGNALKLPANLSADWSPTEFSAAFFRETLARANRISRQQFDAPVTAYADDGGAADRGRDLIRAIYVPPVAIAFSLVFSILNLGGVVSRMVGARVVVAGGAVVAVGAVVLAPDVPMLGLAGKTLLTLEPVIYSTGAVLRNFTIGGLF